MTIVKVAFAAKYKMSITNWHVILKENYNILKITFCNSSSYEHRDIVTARFILKSKFNQTQLTNPFFMYLSPISKD